MKWLWAGLSAATALVLAATWFLVGTAGAHTSPVLAAYAAPALLFALTAGLVLFWPARRKLFLVLAGAGSLAAFGIVLLFSLNPALHYRDALAFWQSQDHKLTAHFPPSISSFQEVSLHADGQVPLGVALIELSVKVSPAELDSLERQYATGALLSSAGSADWTTPESHFSGDSQRTYSRPPVLFYSLGSTRPGPLPEDFAVHVLQFEGKGDLRSWAQGQACGLAISRKQGRVIYWASRWLIS